MKERTIYLSHFDAKAHDAQKQGKWLKGIDGKGVSDTEGFRRAVRHVSALCLEEFGSEKKLCSNVSKITIKEVPGSGFEGCLRDV